MVSKDSKVNGETAGAPEVVSVSGNTQATRSASRDPPPPVGGGLNDTTMMSEADHRLQAF